jgi:hypothetical protein
MAQHFQLIALFAAGRHDFQMTATWPRDIPPPKAGGSLSGPLEPVLSKKPGVIPGEDMVRFCRGRIFPGNLPVLVIAMGVWARRNGSLAEKSPLKPR